MSINVIIDSNYLFHKTFGIFSGYGAKNPEEILSSESDRNMFITKVITDLSYLLNQIPNLGTVVFCRDSRSWRKDFKISRSIYKGNREEKQEGVDWSSFFNLLEEFGEYLSTVGFIYSKYKRAEADDLIWAWSQYFSLKGEKSIILSGDRDMYQLVSFSKNSWTSVWTGNSKNNKLIVPVEWKLEEEKETTIFDVNPLSEDEDLKLQKLISSCQLERVNVKEYVFKKILSGDKGDGIFGVFPHKTKNGKPSNIAEGKANKIWQTYIQSTWKDFSMEDLIEDEEFLNWIAGVSLRILGQTDNNENRKTFKIFYIENAKLVWLHHKTIPEDLAKELKDHVNSAGKNSKKIISLDKKSLIENSKWESSKNSTPKGYNPFEFFN
jgi:5'-3' exonuclease